MNRRRFITCTLGTAGLGAVGWKASHSSGLTKVTRSSRALGSGVHITVHAASRNKGEKAIDAAFEAIEKVESVMSLYRCDSQLCELNRYGALQHPAPQLRKVLDLATALSRQSDGAFDVTVQPLWDLHSRHAQHGTRPSPAQIAEARKRVGWQKLHLEPAGIWLEGGAQITLNGIAQGHAADMARAALIEHGIEHAILDTGELCAVGRNIEREYWSAGIVNPHEQGLVGAAKLDHRSLATSGDYHTVFDQGSRSHHLFDPSSGESAGHCSSVSVMAPTAIQADALSTACFVLGPDCGMELIAATADVDALFIARDGSITRTQGFPVELS